MAARTIWTGSLSFGLVNVPIGLYTATRDRSVHFNQFEEGTSDRIRYRKVNERTGDEVDSDRIVKGVDIGGGDYVVLSDEELEAAAPERSRAIDITEFVDLDEIDPVYFRTSYYLGPQGEAATKAYALLRTAMREARKVGIATFVMRGKEYLVAVRPEEDVLALETMYFADEVRSPTEVLPEVPAGEDLSERELKVARLLIDSMADEWDPTRYHDTYRQRVDELVDQKRRGEEIVTEAPVAPRSNVVDLMEALQASVKAVRGGRGDAGADAGTETDEAATPALPPRRAGAKPRASKAKKVPAGRAAKKAPAKRVGGTGRTASTRAKAPSGKVGSAKATPAKATPAKATAARAGASPKPGRQRKAS